MSDLDPAPEPDEPVEVAQLDIHQRRAKAYHLHFVQRHTLPYVAQTMGCAISTAWRLAHQGKAQAAFLRSTDDEVRGALADAAGWLVSALAAEHEAGFGRMAEYAPVILRVLEFEAKIRVPLAAQRHVIEGQVGAVMNPDTVAAIEATFAKEGRAGRDGIAPQY